MKYSLQLRLILEARLNHSELDGSVSKVVKRSSFLEHSQKKIGLSKSRTRKDREKEGKKMSFNNFADVKSLAGKQNEAI